jgi:hypothetical protein
MLPADTSRVGHLAPCVEFHHFLGTEDPMVACSGTVIKAQPFGVPIHTYSPRGTAPNDPVWGTSQKNGLTQAMGPDIFLEKGVFAVNMVWRAVFLTARCAAAAPGSPPLRELLVPTPWMGFELPLIPSMSQVLSWGCGSPSSNWATEGHW